MAFEVQNRLDTLGDQIARMALLFVDHVEQIRNDGYINKLKKFDVSHLGGLVGQFYYEGAYDLKPDEALIVEARIPSGCSYWSIVLTRDLYETTEWYNKESGLNGSRTQVDADGIVLYVVQRMNPGVPNGSIPQAIGTVRFKEDGPNARQPIPSMRKVAFTDVRALLPAETPGSYSRAERQAVVADTRRFGSVHSGSRFN